MKKILASITNKLNTNNTIEREDNRMVADVISSKAEALGWKPIKKIKDYIEENRKNDWK
jgi:hypothetical protein